MGKAWIYVSSGNFLARYNVVSHKFKLIGDMGREMYDIAMSPKGKLYGVDSSGSKLFKISKCTAATEEVGPLSPPSFINALAFNACGTLYGMNGSMLVTIDKKLLTVTNVGDTGFVSGGDITFLKRKIYLATEDEKLARVNKCDPSQSVEVGPLPLTYGLATVRICHKAAMYGTSGTDLSVYKIDPATGAISDKTFMPAFGTGSTQGATGACMPL